MFAFIDLNITVVDANDNSPMFVDTPYSVTVPEGTTQEGVVFTAVAIDADSTSNGRIVYSISGDISDRLNINSSTVNYINNSKYIIQTFTNRNSNNIE